MNSKGYVIARNRKVEQFFTSRSAYDRPQWIGLTEATVYATPEMAQMAWTKLAKSGAYEARVVPVSEAIELSLPDEPTASPNGDVEVDFEMNANGDTEMVAADQEVPCEQCDHCPCTCDNVENGVEDIVDDMIGNDGSSPGPDTSNDMGTSPEGRELAMRLPAGRRGMGESATMPAKPSNDLPSDENKKTAVDLPAPEVIKYKQPAHPEDGGEKTPVIGQHGETLKVPAEIIRDLKACIDEHTKEAEQKSTYNDTRASFCKTIAGAAEELLMHLEKGTTDGMKMAQVHLTSLMSPISCCLPTSVLKFVQMGGRKPSLKDLFDAKREESKVNEAVNHLGDRVQTTYAGWKRACKAAYPNCTFRGDKDIGAAVLDGKDVGEWDGYEGSVYKKAVNEAVNHLGDRVQTTYAGWKRACKAAYPNCTFRGDKDIGAAVLDGKDVGEWDGYEGSVYKKQETK